MILLIIHLLGGIISLFIICHKGLMKFAVNYGDGIRWAKPSDIVFRCFIMWEILLLVYIITYTDSKIDEYFGKKYGGN